MRTIVAVLCLGFCFSTVTQAIDKGPEREKKGKPRFTIGKETTFVDGPIDKEGYVDYPAALNEILRKGVTPENNANVLIWKALGPRPERKPMQPEYFKWMGIEEPPDRGDYFIPLERYLEDQKLDIRKGDPTASQLIDRTTFHTWTAKQYPQVAAWLKANEKPLVLVVEASKRPRYYNPLVPTTSEKGSEGLYSARLSSVQACRFLIGALAARSMLHTGEGRNDDAWQDLLACHRLSRLIGHGGTLIESLVDFAGSQIACRASVAFLARANLEPKQLMQCLRDLQQLPARPSLADKYSLVDRFSMLETAMMIDRHGLEFMDRMSGGGGPGDPPNLLTMVMLKGLHWDQALRTINRGFDQVVEVVRGKDRQARKELFEKFDVFMKNTRADMQSGKLYARIIKENKPTDVTSKGMGEILFCLLCPAVGKVMDSADRAQQNQDNLHVAFALAAHQRAEHGSYPKSLDALAPKYLMAIPRDLFSDKPLLYRPTEDGYLLYSVGVNGRDDEGQSASDRPPGDDLSVRMPPRRVGK